MQRAQPIRHVASCNITELAGLLPDFGDPVWDRYEILRRRWAAHRQTRTIVFVLSDGWNGLEVPMPLQLDYASKPLIEAAKVCGEQIAAQFPSGAVKSLMVTELQVGAAIGRHYDDGLLMRRAHRCHLPVVTNPDVRFEIDGANHALLASEVYEIDNTRVHAVSNTGAASRVHLICDVWSDESDRLGSELT